MPDRAQDLLQQVARVSRMRDGKCFETNTRAHHARDDQRNFGQINTEVASEVLDQVHERRADLETRIELAPNGKSRSPLRKEHWWLGYLAELLEKWIALGRM